MDSFRKEKTDNVIEAIDQLVALLHRCDAAKGVWDRYFLAVKNKLLDGDLDLAFEAYDQIPMPNMGGFTDLVLTTGNGHTVRDAKTDNELLVELTRTVDLTVHFLRIYSTRRIMHPKLDIPNGS